MGRYLAIYNGAADEAEKAEISDEQSNAFMSAWAKWAQDNQDAIVDGGAPLFRKKRLTSLGSEDFTDSKTGYAIVEAETHEAAARIFSDHPHLGLHEGNWIEVLECPPSPR